jgi:pimeloyl-ACP methyl ester carboxylesterase
MSDESQFATIVWRDREITIEYRWIAAVRPDAPLLVFLHEGLGSVSMWRDFPARLCEAGGFRGLVFSRPGYGRSTPRESTDHWQPDFMHRQAQEVLPAFFAAVEVDQPMWLFGHSDGGSISLLHAARFTDRVTGAIVMAPHILVEAVTIEHIELTRQAYETTDLRAKLGRHHDDPDSAFRGWNDIWLHPEFRCWNIEAELESIRCPILAIQGIDDQYGSLQQIRGIADRVTDTELLELPACGHSPHKDQPQAVIDATLAFVAKRTQPRAR